MKEGTIPNTLIPLLEGTILPALNSIELQRYSIVDFLNRYNSPYPNIAELFHQNTRLNEYTKQTIVTDEKTIDEVKKWYLTTNCKIKEEDIEKEKGKEILKEVETLPNNLDKLFINFSSNDNRESELLYSSNLFLLWEQKIYKIVPLSKSMLLMLKFTPEDINLLKESIIIEDTSILKNTENFLFVVGVPWRNMIFYSSRGYRKMLIDTGKLVYYLERQAEKNNLRLSLYENFYDTQINRLLNLDGVENIVTVIIGINGD